MMLSRSSNVIYKPYYCLLSNKFSAGFGPTTWHSSSANSFVNQPDNELKKTKEALYIASLLPNELRRHEKPTALCYCSNKNLDNAGKTISMSELRSSSIFKKINPLEDVYVYQVCKEKEFKANSISINGKEVNHMKYYSRFSTTKYLNSGINASASNNSPLLKSQNIRSRGEKDPKNSKENWNDLPSEGQMTEMMLYFHDQAPKLFTTLGWSYIRCSYKVVFENQLIGTKTETLNSYILQINILKNLTKLVLYNPELSILQMNKNSTNGSIHVRWQVQGIPRYIKPLAMIGLVDERESSRYIDGYSIFYMKSDGLYHKHILMKMTPMKSEG